MNIREFEGMDADSWIQVIEQYIDAARTPLEQRTEIGTTYLKGPQFRKRLSLSIGFFKTGYGFFKTVSE